MDSQILHPHLPLNSCKPSAQLELLEKGLSFIPTPKLPTRPEIRADLHAFHRRIKIMDHFLGCQRRQPVLFRIGFAL
ncbi:hypothetical protein NQZ68_035611 [Dissostichus eleginoides]|nr:hypothetical protein NQZ68_035611 [Dissostichus eleginoides]